MRLIGSLWIYIEPLRAVPELLQTLPKLSQGLPKLPQGLPEPRSASRGPWTCSGRLDHHRLRCLLTKSSRLEFCARSRRSRLFWCQEPLLGPHLPHAPGARMTVVTLTPSKYILDRLIYHICMSICMYICISLCMYIGIHIQIPGATTKISEIRIPAR